MKALIMCNGEAPTKDLLQKEVEDSQLIIGADGGGQTLIDFGFTPDAVVGDLDSFEAEKYPEAKLVKISEQESNDLEKSLNYALEAGAKKCVIMGAFGKRADHGLKNLSVLYAYYSKFEVIYFRDIYQDIFLISSPYNDTFPIGTTISFIPFAGPVHDVTIKGFKYPLSSESVINGERDATSNITTEEEVEVVFKDGPLLTCVIQETGLKFY